MSDIFFSYASEDKAVAKIIAGALEARKYSVWWDTVIPPGETFDEVIERELDATKCVIVLWSHESVKSKWVKTEASEGDRRGILVPVLIEKDVKIPLAFRRIEAAKLTDWDGTQPNPEFDLLLKSISKILSRYGDKEESNKKPKVKVKLAAGQVMELEARTKAEEGSSKNEETLKTYTNSIGMEFVPVLAGEFDMGSLANEAGRYDDEGPVHRVKLTKAFYMGKFEVTQKQWRDVMGTNPSYFSDDGLPVEQISWNDIQEFIEKLNKKENTNKYRLPSEAEWEYTARAGTVTRYYFGNDEAMLGDYAWYYTNSDRKTHSVGQKKPNPWGLYDVHGNVWEWVQDIYQDSYSSAPTDGSAWEGDGSERVLRGGSWFDDGRICRSAFRGYLDPSAHGFNFGFRLLRDL